MRDHPFWRMTDANNDVLCNHMPEDVDESEARDEDDTRNDVLGNHIPADDTRNDVLGNHIPAIVDENEARHDNDIDFIVIDDSEDQDVEDIDDESEDSPTRPSDVSDERESDAELFLRMPCSSSMPSATFRTRRRARI